LHAPPSSTGSGIGSTLGKFYRVSSIPYVLFVDAKGNVVDRLLGFEPPTLFEKRLRKALP
jgi:thioredoxin-related protein